MKERWDKEKLMREDLRDKSKIKRTWEIFWVNKWKIRKIKKIERKLTSINKLKCGI